MNKLLGIFILILFSTSCSSDLDFDQANDLKLEPVVIANLAFFDMKANQFIVGGVEQPLVGDIMDFKVFEDEDFADSTTRADFFFEFTNTVNRAFIINLYLLDDNNTRLYAIPFSVNAYTVGAPIMVSKTEIFENAKLDILKKTTKIAFAVALLPGPPLNSNSTGSLKLRSSATLYLVFQ
ncbi:hypothetical protein [Flavobacterium sp.]|jgi:hypothetical protein|uniref:hypothetical protein n=1 Tax=Flavobacterium sp. TaxID=239 RepID=UPI0037C15F5F